MIKNVLGRNDYRGGNGIWGKTTRVENSGETIRGTQNGGMTKGGGDMLCYPLNY